MLAAWPAAACPPHLTPLAPPPACLTQPDPPGLRIVERDGKFIRDLARSTGLPAADSTLGVYVEPYRLILIREGLPADCRALVLTHELAHARCAWRH